MTDMRSILGAMAERNKMEPEEIPEPVPAPPHGISWKTTDWMGDSRFWSSSDSGKRINFERKYNVAIFAVAFKGNKKNFSTNMEEKTYKTLLLLTG